MTPAETWKDLFEHAEDSTDPAEHAVAEEMQKTDALFVPSRLPASKEILRLLQENEPDTISIVAIGPLTNLALTASLDTETFLRAKEIVVMGGAVEERGNVSVNLCAIQETKLTIFLRTDHPRRRIQHIRRLSRRRSPLRVDLSNPKLNHAPNPTNTP